MTEQLLKGEARFRLFIHHVWPIMSIIYPLASANYLIYSACLLGSLQALFMEITPSVVNVTVVADSLCGWIF